MWLLIRQKKKKIIRNFDQRWKGNVNVRTSRYLYLFRSEHHYERRDRVRGAIYSVEVSNYPFSLSTTLLSLYDRMFLWITESRYMIARTFEPDFSKENSVWPKNPASRSIYILYIYILYIYIPFVRGKRTESLYWNCKPMFAHKKYKRLAHISSHRARYNSPLTHARIPFFFFTDQIVKRNIVARTPWTKVIDRQDGNFNECKSRFESVDDKIKNSTGVLRVYFFLFFPFFFSHYELSLRH